MKFGCSFVAVAAVVALTLCSTDAFRINVDWMPVVSQLKSAGQAIMGDSEGARKTQETFVRTAPLISQINSLGHAIAGKTNEAKHIQEDFYNEHLIDNKENLDIALGVAATLMSDNNKAGAAAALIAGKVLDKLPRAGDH